MVETINIFKLFRSLFKKSDTEPVETPNPIQPQIKSYVPKKSFNDEIVWGYTVPLFDIYYRDTIIRDRYELAYFDLPEDIDFEDAMNILVSIN